MPSNLILDMKLPVLREYSAENEVYVACAIRLLSFLLLVWVFVVVNTHL